MAQADALTWDLEHKREVCAISKY